LTFDATNLRLSRVLSGLLIPSIVLCFLFLLVPGQGSAADFEKPVDGRVYDEFGDPLLGVRVTLTVYHGGDVGYTDWMDTITGGFFTFTVPASYWFVGDTFEVVAVDEGVPESNTGVATLDDFEFTGWDIHFPTAIPQFGGFIGSLLVGLVLSAVAIVFLGSRRH